MKCKDQWIGFQKADAPLNIKQQNVIWFTREHFLCQAGEVSPWILEFLIVLLYPPFESCRSLYPVCGGLFILHTHSMRMTSSSSSFDFTLPSLCVCVSGRALVCLCECVSIISVPVQLRFSSALLFFLNVIVECSSEMNLHTRILTEGNTIGYILLTPRVMCLFQIHTFLPE